MPHIHELYDYTTSAFILHPTENKILLLLHKKIGKWLQPGGHIELDENPLQALHHEIEEETGLKPSEYDILEPADRPRPSNSNDPLPLPFYMNEHYWDGVGPHKHIDICYLVKARSSKLTDSPDGAAGIGWYGMDKIQELYETGVLYEDTKDICEWIFLNKV